MPKNHSPAATVAVKPTATTSLDSVREIADALCRAAHECYLQHGRSARLSGRGTVETIETEARGLERLCAVCDETLESLTTAYEKAATTVRPGADEQEWWHRANALWLACREYARRHKSCDASARRLAAHHSPSELEDLHLEFEFEASALLALKQTCDDYFRTRPGAL